jgi:hypothetical protein
VQQEEVPVQEAPVQEEPVPVQEEPVPVQEEAPVQEAPVPVQQEEPVPVQEAPVQEEPVPVQEEPVPVQEEPVPVQEEPVPVQQEEPVPVQEEEVVHMVAPEPEPEPLYPITHDHVENLHLFFYIRHFISERLLNRAMHSLLDVIPDGKCWEWAANIDVNNINEGVDPMFDALQHNMNSNFSYEITWATNKPAFIWILRQLNYIAKHGISQLKTVYSNFQIPPQLEGLWKLTDPTQSQTPTQPVEMEI